MEYKSNANEVILNIKQKLLSNESQQALLQTIAQTVYSNNAHRVFNKGQNINNTSIGRYSRKPLYANPKKSKKDFSVGGKTGKTIFASTGQKHKTKYFSGGYANLRNQLGKRIDIVDLNFTGTLQANWQMIKTSTGYSIGFLSNKKGLIADGLEKHFKCKIFGVSNDDRTQINQIVKNWAHRK